MKTPEPKASKLICSVCGLDWARHGATKTRQPTLEKCVELLKAELAKRPSQSYVVGGSTYSPPSFYWNTSGGDLAV